MSLVAALPLVGKVLDRILPDKAQREAAKLQLAELEQSGELAEISAKANVIMAEAKGESWLQRNWRPLMMVWFAALVGVHWFGWTPENLKPEHVTELYQLVQLGITGYIVSRGAEKGLKIWKEK